MTYKIGFQVIYLAKLLHVCFPGKALHVERHSIIWIGVVSFSSPHNGDK